MPNGLQCLRHQTEPPGVAPTPSQQAADASPRLATSTAQSIGTQNVTSGSGGCRQGSGTTKGRRDSSNTMPLGADAACPHKLLLARALRYHVAASRGSPPSVTARVSSAIALGPTEGCDRS